MPGSQLPGFDNAPIADLALYTFNDGVWAAIPFQIDEFDAQGKLVTVEDGLLDQNDELVMMGFDGGMKATLSQWPLDVKARQHIRYAIRVTDPLHQNEAVWVYLFRSITLPRSDTAYVTWNNALQTAQTLDYTVVFSDTMIGITNLYLHGSVDVLDRQKIRVDASPSYVIPPITEETLASLLQAQEIPTDIVLAVTGPVRAASANQDLGLGYAFYNAQLELDVALPLEDMEIYGIAIHFESARTSLDWRNPNDSGMAPATYYDSHTPGGVPVDGVPETIPDLPLSNWYQVSGAAGSLISVHDLDPGNGTARGYYRDDSTHHSSDTGDERLFGDAGLLVEAPNATTSIGLVRLNQRFYVLSANAANQGAAYVTRTNNPLQTTTFIEGYVPPSLDFPTYLPLFYNQ